MEKLNTLIAVLAFILSFVSGVVSLFTYFKSLKRQKIIETIEAYRILQADVLDKFVSYSKRDVLDLLETQEYPDNDKAKKFYADCRALIAKIEHFAVGVNNDIYDFDTMDKLGGEHLIYLFKKVKPVIEYTRKNQDQEDRPYYCEFERMIEKLKTKHTII